MMTMRTVALGAAMLVTVAAGASAQRGGRARGGPPPDGQLRPEQRIGQLVQQRLQLSEQQVQRMQDHVQRFRDRRQTLGQEDMQVRRSMRDMICSGDTTKTTEMSRLLDQWGEINKKRVQLQEDEQRELATFLNPYQRAKFLGFEEEVGRLVEGRGGRRGMPGGPPPGDRLGGGGGRGRGMGGPPPDGSGPPPRRGQGPPNACGGPEPPGPMF